MSAPNTSRRWIFHLPLAAAGLLVGWMLFKPKPEASVSVAPPAPVAAPVPSLVSLVEKETPEAFRELLGNRRFHARDVWVRWAAVDPVACYAELLKQEHWEFQIGPGPMSFPGPPNPDEVISTLFKAWAISDPEEALKALHAMPAKFQAGLALSEVLNQLVATDPIATLPLIEKYAGPLGSYSSPTVSWEGVDLSRLATQAALLPTFSYSDTLLGIIATQYGAKDPVAALNWVRSLSGARRQRLLPDVFAEWSKRSPDEVFKLLLETKSAAERLAAAAPLGEILGKGDAKSAWVEAKAAGVLEEMHASLASSWSQNDPVAAVEFVLQQEEEYHAKALHSIHWSWRWRDAKAAGASAAQLPESKAKWEIMKFMISDWAKADPAAAAQYVTSDTLLAQQSAKEFAGTVSYAWAEQDPAAATNWAVQLPEEIRENAVRGAFYTWATKDRTASRAAAEALTDAATRQKAIEGVAQAGG